MEQKTFQIIYYYGSFSPQLYDIFPTPIFAHDSPIDNVVFVKVMLINTARETKNSDRFKE